MTVDREKLRKITRKYGMLISFFALSIIISFLTPNFLSLRNLINILRQSSIIGIMAIGTTFVILSGEIDISVGSTLALSAAITLGLQKLAAWPIAVFVALLVGVLIGAFNGVFEIGRASCRERVYTKV